VDVTADPHGERYFSKRRGLVSLWGGVLLPPAAFLLNLQVAYAVVAVTCARAAPWVHVTSALLFVLALVGGAIAYSQWRRSGGGPPGDGGNVLDRSRFLAAVGGMGSALFSLIILMQWVALLLLPPCGQI
jgi:hypothetical protein